MSSARSRRLAKSAPPQMPSFAVRLGLDSGVHRLLETPLVINGAEGSTILRFLGSQAAAARWPEYGGAGTLALQAGTAPTYGVASPYLGALDTGVKGNSGGWFQGAGLGNITTHDFAVELVFQIGTNTTEQIFATQQGTAKGWVLYTGAVGTTINGYTKGDAAGSAFTLATAGGSLLHVLWIYDSSDSSIGYVNNVASAAVDVSARGSLTTTNPLYLGHYAAGAFSSTILFAALHIRAPGWLDSHLQPTLAAQRLALLTASRPAFSAGGITAPSSVGSTSPVYSPKVTAGVEQLFLVGAGAPTFGRILDANGSAVVVHQVEAASKSVLLQSQTLGTTWAKLDAGDTIGANAALGPDGSLTLESIIADSTDGLHGVSQASSENLTAAAWVLSGYHTIGTLGWLYVDNTTVANCTAYLNATTGAVGTLGAAVVGAGIKAIGTGRVRWWIAFTGTVALHTVRVAVAQADGDSSIVGDGAAVQGYAGCMQLSAGDYPHSYIITTTAAVTCAASSLKYSIANCFPRAEGTVLFGLIGESFTPARARVLMSLDDGSANNRIEVGTAATTGAVSALGRKAAGTDGDAALAGSVFDLLRRPGMLSWREGELSIWLKSAGVWSVARDATFTPPAGATLTTLCVGHDNAIANHAGSGLYPLSGIYLLPNYYQDPSAVRCGSDNLWSRDYY